MELWKDGPQFEQSEHFRLGTDSVLLADFVNIGARRRGIDLGCGSGILPLLLLTRSTTLHMTGLELNPEAARVARENIAANALDDRCDIVVGDIRRCRDEFKTGQFDLIVSNPPYFAAGSGKLSPNADKAAARGEVLCTLEDVCRCGFRLLKDGGRLALCHRPERLAEVLAVLRANRLEPKRLAFVKNKPDAAPWLFLVEAQKNRKTGLRIQPDVLISAGAALYGNN